MANGRRGEIEAEIDGRRMRLCLTLGALAELEHAFEADDLPGLGLRFSEGRIAARDLMRIIGAGLRGGGQEISDAEVGALNIEGGIEGWIRLVSALFEITFGGAEATTPRPPVPQDGRPLQAV